VPSVSSAAFDGAHYVALGHLHRRQDPASVGTSARLHYSGSPLRYSISDAGHDKSMTLVELGPDGEVQLEHVVVRQPREMADLRGTVDELTGPVHERHRESWVRLVITDRQRPDDTVRRLRDCFPFQIDVRFEPEGAHAPRHGVLVTASSDPLDVIDEFARSEKGESLTADERLLLDLVLAELRIAERAQ
jgi:exonuclease SbcD